MRTDDAPSIVRLEDYRPTPYAIDEVALDVRLAPQSTQVSARMAVRRRDGTAPGAPLVLDGDGLSLRSLRIDGQAVSDNAVHATPDRLELSAPPDEPFTLEVETELDPSANRALMGLYRSNGTYTTQCEPEGFRRITYFLDRPDVLATYTTRLEARRSEAPVLLSNGNLVSTGDIAGTERHFAVWHDPHPKPSYLFALVAGDLASIHESFVTASGRDVALAIYCEAGKEDRCRFAMEALVRSMRWDEEVFGREYDLDVFNVVAVSDFNMGAMENKGLNIFNDKFVLADPETATDADYARIEAVIAHEYLHNWTGNRVTCRDWFQLCLKEGLTVFRDQEFTSDMRSRPVKRIADVALLCQHQFPEDAGPLAHPVRPRTYREINNFYTATVYEKGAELVRMLKTILGEEGFRDGLELYLDRHDGDAATIEDFLSCFAESSGRDLSQFALWYEHAGTPGVTTDTDWDPGTGTLRLSLAQTIPATPEAREKPPMHIPLRFGLVGPDGADMRVASDGTSVEGDVIHLTEARQDVAFTGLAERPVPSLNRGFSAPIVLAGDLSREERLFLVSHDADPFTRWDALQSLALEGMVEAAGRDGANSESGPEDDFIAALEALATDEDLDPDFRAVALRLPSEIDIAQAFVGCVDPDAVHAARTAWKRAIGERLGATLLVAAARAGIPDPAAVDPRAAGLRSLRAAALDYATYGDASLLDGMVRDIARAPNLTDRLLALRLFVHRDHPQAPEMLELFRGRYAKEPLVLDKWFTVQATRPGPGTLEVVAALTRDPAYSPDIPNRVYALVRSFGAANPTGFNRPDGAGYEFLGEQITAIDPRNPSVAARLATCFRSWRELEARRRAKVETVLDRLRRRDDLSRDVSDIVTRTLSTG